MATVKFKGSPVATCGELPMIGSKAPNATLVNGALEEIRLRDYVGRKLVLNVFPSIDTSVCAASVRRFNVEAASLADTTVLCISRDLPFAQARFCGAEGIANVVCLSDFRTGEFGTAYGVNMLEGPLARLLARAVFVLDEQGVTRHVQLVPEITQEPDYVKVLAALRA